MISIGSLAKQIRETIGWSQRETAKELKISVVHLCNIENNKNQPSWALLDRFQKLWGIDLYVLTWCKNIDTIHPSLHPFVLEIEAAYSKLIFDQIQKDKLT